MDSEASRLATATAVAGTVGSYLKVGGGMAASYLKMAATAAMSTGAVGSPGSVDVSLRALGSAEVLKMAATLDGIFSGELAGATGDIQKPEVPRLVVVGTQSSGKSSLLNGIMGADILPLGEQMVTRAPLSLQLMHTPDESAMRAEFGDFVGGSWAAEETIPLLCPVSAHAHAWRWRAAHDPLPFPPLTLHALSRTLVHRTPHRASSPRFAPPSRTRRPREPGPKRACLRGPSSSVSTRPLCQTSRSSIYPASR